MYHLDEKTWKACSSIPASERCRSCLIWTLPSGSRWSGNCSAGASRLPRTLKGRLMSTCRGAAWPDGVACTKSGIGYVQHSQDTHNPALTLLQQKSSADDLTTPERASCREDSRPGDSQDDAAMLIKVSTCTVHQQTKCTVSWVGSRNLTLSFQCFCSSAAARK